MEPTGGGDQSGPDHIYQRGATQRKTEHSQTLWEKCKLANACLDIPLTQLSRPIPYRHLIPWSTDGGGTYFAMRQE